MGHARRAIVSRAKKCIYGTVFVALLCTVAVRRVIADEPMYNSGQDVALAFEGWEPNPDGSYNFVFGYLNRNYQESLDVPIGPDNNISPGNPDQGQPTHFLPRRNRYVFRVRVPKDFGNKELVWTVTANGKTEKAYGTLKPDYESNARVMMLNHRSMRAGGRDFDVNRPPELKVMGPTRLQAKVGERVALTAVASDDGIPKRTAARTPLSGSPGALGLRVAWFIYRGAGRVTFEPEQFNIWVDYRPDTNTPWTPGWMPPPLPADGRFPVQLAFWDPGTYVIRAMAHDGGLDATQDVTIDVAAK